MTIRMTAQQAAQISYMARALGNLPNLTKAAAEDKPKQGYDRKVLNIEIAHETDDGGESSDYVTLDMETTRRLMPVLARFLRDELEALGVEIAPDEKSG